MGASAPIQHLTGTQSIRTSKERAGSSRGRDGPLLVRGFIGKWASRRKQNPVKNPAKNLPGGVKRREEGKKTTKMNTIKRNGGKDGGNKKKRGELWRGWTQRRLPGTNTSVQGGTEG